MIRRKTVDSHWSTGSSHFRSFSWFLRPFILGSMNAINCPSKINVEDLITWQSSRHHGLYSQMLDWKNLMMQRTTSKRSESHWCDRIMDATVGHGVLIHDMAVPLAAGGRCGLWLSWTGWGTSPRPQNHYQVLWQRTARLVGLPESQIRLRFKPFRHCLLCSLLSFGTLCNGI